MSIRHLDALGKIPQELIGIYDVVQLRLFQVVVKDGDPGPLLRNVISMLSARSLSLSLFLAFPFSRSIALSTNNSLLDVAGRPFFAKESRARRLYPMGRIRHDYPNNHQSLPRPQFLRSRRCTGFRARVPEEGWQGWCAKVRQTPPPSFTLHPLPPSIWHTPLFPEKKRHYPFLYKHHTSPTPPLHPIHPSTNQIH